ARLKVLENLYMEAFPKEERRGIKQLEYFIDHKKQMYFNAIEDNGVLAGFFVYWKFEAFYFLEHLAICPELRNNKIGQQLLDYVKDNLKGTRILEVEPFVDEMTGRRIKYYQRNGYEIVKKDYIQPLYDGSGEGLGLWIMSNVKNEDPSVLEQQIGLIIDEVYKSGYSLVDL
ncbi:GNAT family N-acetyltransferase, partial [Odoribacter sp. OttesenSCG-928-A06]|nr:GNAT family N-acetyltransferase [Odoribacter sp. OttesenSCG-928-A06]